MARPRWDALQRMLADKMQDICADRNAIDVSRILRVVGTVNTKAKREGKTDAVVCVAWTNVAWHGEPCTKSGIRLYDFDELCDRVLPYQRKGEQSAEIKAWSAAKAHEKTDRIKPSKWTNLTTTQSDRFFEKLASSEIWWSRALMIKGLVEMRYGGAGVAEGQRETFVWMIANALAWSTPDGQTWDDSLEAMTADMVPSFTHKEVLTYTTNIRRRLQAHLTAKEERRETGWDEGLYEMKHATFCQKLNMSPAEIVWADEMKATGLSSVQRRRGVKSGKVRKSKNTEKKIRAVAMSAAGMSARAISIEIGVSYDTARLWLK